MSALPFYDKWAARDRRSRRVGRRRDEERCGDFLPASHGFGRSAVIRRCFLGFIGPAAPSVAALRSLPDFWSERHIRRTRRQTTSCRCFNPLRSMCLERSVPPWIDNRFEKSRWRRGALLASIILNLFLIALIGGHLMHGHRGENAGSPLARALANAESVLPPQDAAAFGEIMRQNAPRFAASSKRLADSRQELAQQITADRYDENGVRHALAESRAAWNQFLDDFDDSLAEALSKVSPEGRRKLLAERQRVHALPPHP